MGYSADSVFFNRLTKTCSGTAALLTSRLTSPYNARGKVTPGFYELKQMTTGAALEQIDCLFYSIMKGSLVYVCVFLPFFLSVA